MGLVCSTEVKGYHVPVSGSDSHVSLGDVIGSGECCGDGILVLQRTVDKIR